jgi:protein PET117
MSRAAKATLVASIIVSSLTVWGVHYIQQQEHEVRPFLRVHGPN